MKKITSFLFLISFVFLNFQDLNAQVNSYTFTQSISGYAPISAPTVAIAAPWDANAAVAVPIGFTFVYDSVNFTQCFVNPNGFITFGSTGPSGINATPLSDNTAYNGATSGGVASALGTDLASNGSPIEYAVEGTAPNRTFVVQWSNVNRKSVGVVVPGDFDFQIRLSETTNVITFFYGNCDTTLSAASVTVQVGLRGQNNDITQGNVFNRVQGSSQLWANAGATTQGFANNSTLFTNSLAYPNFGLQYIFTPGLPCILPSAQPTGLVLGGTSITHNAFTGNSFIAASPSPSKYLILRSTVNTPPTALVIVNRTIYAVGTNVGTAPVYRVISNSNLTTFTQTGLLPSTTYYYWIISYNDKCAGAPFYNLVSPLFGSATTCFQATTAGIANPIGGNNFTANWSAVTGATSYSIDVSTNSTFTALVPGYSNLTLPAGTTSLAVVGLLPSTNYYYRVRANGPGCIVNSAIISVTTSCGYYTIPYTQNFDAIGVGTVPNCYGVINSNADSNAWKTQSLNYASASNSIQINSNPALDMDDWFFLPGLNLTAGVSYRLFFRYNTGNIGSTSENLRVFYGTTQNIAGMSTAILNLSGFDTSFYDSAQVDFTPISSGVYYLGFQGYSIANQAYIVVDDISVTLSPSCIDPTDVTIAAITATTATVSWTASTIAPAMGYEYYVSTSSVPPVATTVATGTVGAGVTSVVLNGLSPSTYYSVWVRGKCSATDKSVWTLEEPFNTECSTPSVMSIISPTRCGYGTATLTAVPSVGSAIRWYDSLVGGVLLGTGNTYTTPSILSTTTYYAESRAFGAIAKVGPSSPTTEGGVKGVQNFQAFINFTVYSPTSLQSVDIFPMVSGQGGKLVIRNSTNITLASFPFTTLVSGGNTLQQLLMNYQFDPGAYNLYFDTLPASGVRMNTTNSAYPYDSSVASITGNGYDDNFYLGVYNWKFTTECLSTRVAVTATITAPPVLTLSTSGLTICEDNTTPLVTVSGYASYSTLVWSPSTNVSGSLATGFTFNPTTTTTYTLFANQNSGSFCGTKVSLTVTVLPAPPAVDVLPINPSICVNTIQPLFGSTSLTTPAIVFDEKFNGTTSNWVVQNTSTGGNPLASQWTLQPSGYNYINGFGWNALFSSNDSTPFYLANSDSQSSTAGATTKTTLTSPAFSLQGYTTANFSFWHYIRSIAFDKFQVQISTDNAVSWTTIQSFTTTQGTPSGFVYKSISLSAYLGNPNLKIRFNYESSWGYCWAVDNILLSGTLSAAMAWTPSTGLYTDAAATIPYVSGTALSVVYAKPLTTTTYVATLTGSNGCFRTGTDVVTVSPETVSGVLSGSQSICTNAPISNLLLTGNVGTILRWEYADDPGFSINLTTISNTTSVLTPAQMGTIPSIRYFRVVVKSNFCNQMYSNSVYVALPVTTWNGTAWSNGVPTSGVRAIFNGAYSSTGNLSACSVQVNSGIVTFNPGHTLLVDNDVVVAGGSLVFENTASLVQVNSVANSGSIVYKRNTTSMTRFDFTYWSSPVLSQTLVGFSPLTPSDKFFKFDPVTANWANVLSSSTMAVGKGYIIRAPSSFSTTVGAVYNGIFTGTPNNGAITTPITVSTSNFNLIGNPYPSALSADLFLSDPANIGVIDATLYLWTHNTPVAANQYTSADYAVYNYLGGTGTSSAPNIGVNTSVPNGKLASGQGFFVKGLATGFATFSNSMRLVGVNNQFFKTASSIENETSTTHRIWLDIVDAQGAYKQTLIGYAAGATLNQDRGYDSDCIAVGNSVSVYTMLGAVPQSIQGRPLPFEQTDEVAVGYSLATAGAATLSLYDFDGLFLNQPVYLKDNQLNVIHNLKISPYTFVSNSGVNNTRFSIIYQDQLLGTTPVDFSLDQVVLYKPNQDIHLSTGTKAMKSVAVFDTSGRLLLRKEAVDATSTVFNVGDQNQLLMVQITMDDGLVVIKKYIN